MTSRRKTREVATEEESTEEGLNTVEETDSSEPVAPPSSPLKASPGESEVLLDVYFSLREVRKGHQPGKRAFVQAKHEVTRRTVKTPAAWDQLFESY